MRAFRRARHGLDDSLMVENYAREERLPGALQQASQSQERMDGGACVDAKGV
jgi:hypothetical protein